MKFKKEVSKVLALALVLMSFSSIAVFNVSASVTAIQYIISNCDTNWAIGPVDSVNKVEGFGSVANTASNQLIFQTTLAPINIGLSESDAAASFWFYVSNATGITLAVFDLTSSGTPDVNQYQWVYEPAGGWYSDASATKISTGWNHIVIPFGAAMRTGTPNKSAINFVRAYLNYGSTTKTFAVDDIRVVDYKKTIKSVNEPTISTTTGTGFADAFDQVTVDAVTYGGTTIKGLPVDWNRNGYQSSLAEPCQVTGAFPVGTAEKYGIIDSNTPITANVNVISSSVATLKYVISNCDTADFGGTASTFDTQNKVEGTGSVTATQNGQGMIIFQKTFAPVNLGITEANGALDIWIYMENVDKTVSTQIELNSDTAPNDSNEFYWGGVDNINLNKGWNRLILKLNQVNTKIGNVDINSLSFFRFYTIFGANNVSNTIKIDSVKLIDWTTLSSDTVGTVVSNCDSSAAGTGWDAAYLSQSFCKEGTGAFKLSTSGTFIASRHFPAPLNTGTTEANGALSMWVYSSKTLINDGLSAIELSSSGNPDVDEYQWGMPPLNLKIGWNHLTLYFSDAVKKGNPNLSAINFFRIYDVGATNNTFFLDDIRIIKDESVHVVNFKSYHVYGDEITNIQPNTAEADFRANLAPRSGTTFDFKNLTSGKVATGTLIDEIVAGNVIKTFSVIIYGDTSGDGIIDTLDLVAVKKHLLKTQTLTLEKFSAGDVFNTGVITIGDLLAIKKDILGFRNISQNPNFRAFVSKPIMINPLFATEDTVVADYVVTSPSYQADNTGVIDSTGAIQNALNDCYATGGGTVWMPAGTYRVTGTIHVPSFVTLRGDWRDPESGSGSYGTVISAEVASGNNGPVLFQIGGSAGVMGVTTYYPVQNASSPIPYNYTFSIPSSSFAGQAGTYMCSSVINCTMLNSYRGIGINAIDNTKVHELSTVRNVKGTVLYRGAVAYNGADVGTWEHIYFNNSYWANAGAAYNAPSITTLNTWTRANGIAYTLGDLEWDQFYAITCSDYNIGINIVAGARMHFSGEFVWAGITNTNIAVKVDDIDTRWGVLFTRSVLNGSVKSVENNAGGKVKVCDSDIVGTTSGTVTVSSLGTSPTVYGETTSPKVTRAVLYDVTKAPYNAPYSLPQTGLPSADATTAIQAALNDAGNAGGGVVYLKAGWYRITTHLTVPANVELRGSSSVPNRDQGDLSYGTVLLGYEGKGTATPDSATAMVTLNGDNAGIRGLRFFYPENNPAEGIVPYPYTIRGNGANQYAVNIGFTGVYNGIDFGTYRCDNHYIRKVLGVAYSKFIYVGASTRGAIEGCLSNGNAVCRNNFGVAGWVTETNVFTQVIDAITRVSENFIIINGATDEHLMNNFAYGSKNGVIVQSGTAINIFNLGMDNLGTGGYGVKRTGGTVKVVNFMRYNGFDSSGVVTFYNKMNL